MTETKLRGAGVRDRLSTFSTRTIGRIPHHRTVGLVLVLFGAYNVWAVNQGTWHLLYLLPAHYAYPQAPGPVIGLYFALMSFIGAVKGIISVGIDSNAVRFVGLGAIPLFTGLLVLIGGALTDE